MDKRQNPLLQMLPQFTIQSSILFEGSSGAIVSKDIQIVFILQGFLTVLRQERQLSLGENEFILFNPMEEHQLKAGKDAVVARFQLPYEVLMLAGSSEDTRFSCCSVLEKKETDDELRSILTELLQARISNKIDNQIADIKFTFELLDLLIRHYSEEAPKAGSPQLPNKPSQRLSEIRSYMQANFKQPLTLTEVADLHYISVPYLSKSFRKEMGMTFSDYLNKIRLDHAVVHLLCTEQPITRIAMDSGFPSLAAFNRVFGETYQLTPSQYRKAAFDSGRNVQQEELLPLQSCSNEKLRELKAMLDHRIPKKSGVTVIEADAESARDDNQVWKHLINVGYARDLLNSDLQEQLSFIRSELGFSYARIWGIFSDDMMIEDPSDSRADYNFSNIDKLIDTLIKNNLRPYLELGDKPKLIQKNVSQKMATAASLPRERGPKEWSRLIRAFLIHCINRYGSEEVESWYFELWHSSKHAFLSEGIDQLVGRGYEPGEMKQWFENYFVRFDLTWNEIKDVLPGARVGGCGLSMDLEGRYLSLLLDMWGKRSIQPDFLSVYLYPYEFKLSEADTPPVFAHSADEQWILHTLQSIKRSMAEYRMEHLPLHVSEWNFSISNRDCLNDSIFKAAYIIKNMIAAMDENCMMGYWLYSDIFSEYRDSKQLLHGGAGLLSKNGIKKPAYYAFAFLNRMGKKPIGKGRDFLLTKRSGGSYQLLCFHYRHFEPNCIRDPEPGSSLDITEKWVEHMKPPVRKFRLKSLKDGSYRLKRSILSGERGSILEEWKKLGAVHDIRPDEILFLKQICMPYISVEYAEVRDGWLEISSELSSHEVCLIELELRIDTV